MCKGIVLNKYMTTTTRKRSNTPIDNTPLPTTFRETDPVIKDLKDKWAGMTDDEIRDACLDE